LSLPPFGVGFVIGPGFVFDDPSLAEPWWFARVAEDAGFGWLVVRDQEGSIRLGSDDVPSEPMALLGGFARRTERIVLGVLAEVPGRRSPALVVHALSSVDRFSGGRSALVWTAAPGLADPTALAEAVAASIALVRQPAASFDGSTLRLEQAWNRPGPLHPERVGLLVGVDDEGSEELAGAAGAPIVAIRRVNPGDRAVPAGTTVLLEPTGTFDPTTLLRLAGG